MTAVGWLAAADGLVALYLAAHTVLHRPRNAPQVAAVAVALVVVGIALGLLALRTQPPPGPVPLEPPAVTRALPAAVASAGRTTSGTALPRLNDDWKRTSFICRSAEARPAGPVWTHRPGRLLPDSATVASREGVRPAAVLLGLCDDPVVMLPTLLYLVGAMLSVGHVLLLSRANPGRELPWVGRPANTTAVDLAIYTVGMFSVIRAASDSAGSLGVVPAYLLALVALLVPVAVVTGLHNGRVRRHSLTSR